MWNSLNNDSILPLQKQKFCGVDNRWGEKYFLLVDKNTKCVCLPTRYFQNTSQRGNCFIMGITLYHSCRTLIKLKNVKLIESRPIIYCKHVQKAFFCEFHGKFTWAIATHKVPWTFFFPFLFENLHEKDFNFLINTAVISSRTCTLFI